MSHKKKPGKTIGVMIAFKPNPEHSTTQRRHFYRQLTGYIDFSNHGKFQYSRPGLLDKIPHIDPIKSLIVINQEDEDKVLSFLKKEGATIYARMINLEKDDIKKLSKKPEKK